MRIRASTRMFEVLGMVGTGLSIIGYLPQVVLLVQTRDSTGLSLRSWSLWFLATTLIMLAAYQGTDITFKVMSTSNWFFATLIFTLAYAFRPRVAENPSTEPAIEGECAY